MFRMFSARPGQGREDPDWDVNPGHVHREEDGCLALTAPVGVQVEGDGQALSAWWS